MSPIDAAIGRARTTISVLILILISGTVAFIEIPKEAEPDVNIPLVFVNMIHRGISPEDAERLLIRPMEQELRSVEGIEELSATAFEGGATVTLEFEAGFDADQALNDVREGVDIAKAELPDETEEPMVRELNFSEFPILVITLSGPLPKRALRDISENLKDEIETIPEVLEVDIGGKREERVEIIVDPAEVESYGLSVADITSVFARNNLLVAAGTLDNGMGRFSIKVPGLIENVEDIMNFPLKVNGDAVVTLADVAEGRRTFDDETGFARNNGEQAFALEVSKRTGENILDTAEAVRKTVERMRKYWPENIQVSFSQDKADHTRQRLLDLQNSVITAILLVMIVIVAMLGPFSGFLVGISIPGSFLLAILALSAADLTINMVVLFGLVLAVGMLVDGVVVVTEYADRKMTEGVHRREAYALGTKRMAWPVIASTATTLAAFLPLAFWTGLVGEFMKYMPITLLATLSASLLMALLFVPTIGALIGRPGAGDEEAMKSIAASESGDVMSIKGFTGLYARFLDRVLTHAGKVIAASVLLLIASQAAYWTFGKGIEFFPDTEPEQVAVYVHARGNLSITEQDAMVREVENRIMDVDGFETVYARSGFSPRDAQEDVIGVLRIEYVDWQERRSSREIVAEIRRRVADLAGIQVEVREENRGPGRGKPIVLELASRQPEKLPAAVEHMRSALDKIGGFEDIEDSRPLPGIEWEMTVDRAQALKFGANIAAVGSMVRMVTKELKLASFRPTDADDEIDIVARFPRRYQSLEQLERLRVPTPAGTVPLSTFVTMSPAPSVSSINRVDGRRVLTVKTDVEKDILPAKKVREIQTWVEENPLPEGVSITYKGEEEEKNESRAFLAKAFAVALFLMAIILVTQFNSFFSAFLILSAVILSTIGVMLGLLAAGEPFGIIMSGLGVIALAGIVVNNNIVLIDTYDRIKTNLPERDAILRTGVQRLRPVMLTTITTILGLLPMMLMINIDFITREVSIGAPSMQMWSSLSLAIVSGLTFATLLTLAVTPAALMLQVRALAWWHKRRENTAPA